MSGSSSRGPGKLFESKVMASLKLLDGMAIRLQDGGSVCKSPVLCDHMYRNSEGIVFAIECKSHNENSFPFKNIPERQLDDLVCWQLGHARSIFLVEYRKHGRVFAINATQMYHEVWLSGRKSLTVEKAAEIGVEVEKNGRNYDLSFLR